MPAAAGLFGPRALPAATTEALNGHLNAILSTPEVRSRMLSMGIGPTGGTQAAFAALVRAETDRYGRLVREFNISAT
jgi:tripartite-type tricarboxylate transporter receptor subunit TctC